MQQGVYRYNEFGHLELWDVSEDTNIDREADHYVQEDIQEFLESFGIDKETIENLQVGDTGTIEDYE